LSRPNTLTAISNALVAALGERHQEALEEGATAAPAAARKRLTLALPALGPLLEDEHPRA
jgi:hypothetical protein